MAATVDTTCPLEAQIAAVRRAVSLERNWLLKQARSGRLHPERVSLELQPLKAALHTLEIQRDTCKPAATSTHPPAAYVAGSGAHP